MVLTRSKWTKDVEESDSDDDWDGSWDDEMPSAVEPIRYDQPWIRAIAHKPRVEDMPTGIPVEIIPGKLYIGDAQCVREDYKAYLKQQKISAVLNMAAVERTPADPKYLAKEWKKDERRGSFLYKAICADDAPTYPLLENHWQDAKQFLDKAFAENRPCLVHCVAGQNRSGLIVCAYYMVYTQTTLVETVALVRLHRGTEVLKNDGFKRQLVQLARQEGYLGPKPAVDERIDFPPPVPVSPPLPD